MGPDESHAPVNNSGFTSGIAAASVATGIRAATLTGVAQGDTSGDTVMLHCHCLPLTVIP